MRNVQQIYQRRNETMADYSRYKTETLERMRDKAWEKYKYENSKPFGNWGDGMRLAKLPENKAWERAKERYEAICEELKKEEIKANCWNI